MHRAACPSPQIAELGPSLRFDIIEANYCSSTLANVYGLDVLDLHFQFRFSLQHRMRDGVHWNAVAHRRMTCLLLAHIANAWGVELPASQPPTGTLGAQALRLAPRGWRTRNGKVCKSFLTVVKQTYITVHVGRQQWSKCVCVCVCVCVFIQNFVKIKLEVSLTMSYS